jgi:hypothetical protein
MIEMLNIFEPNLAEYGGHIRSFHLAEGPGGFIEAISKYRGNPNDVYVGMTLLDDMNDPNIPGWKKTQYFLQNHPNVKIELGADNTGNILNIENLKKQMVVKIKYFLAYFMLTNLMVSK